jgi:polyisoprenoid-binding protein YceI
MTAERVGKGWRAAALAACLLAGAGPGFGQPVTYTLDPAHSFVQFELRHFGTSTVRGRLGPAGGSVTLDRTAGTGEVGVSISMASVSTGFAPFDAHLRAAELLAVVEHPTAWFVSRQIGFDAGRLASLRGELSWRGISQPLTLQATHFNCYEHPRLKREVCGGDFEGRLLRSDFGVSYGVPFVDDAVTLRVQVEGVRAD